MADSPTYGTALLDTLRSIVGDTAYEFPVLSVQAPSGSGYTSATLEVLDDTLIVTLDASASTVGLTEEDSDTIEKLQATIRDINAALIVRLVADSDPHMAAAGIEPMPPTSIYNTTVVLRARKWADRELGGAVERAVQRHNLSIPVDASTGWTGDYTANNVPVNHQQFILLLGQIELLKVQIADATKRRGIDISVPDLTSLLSALEAQYEADLRRYMEWLDRRPSTPDEDEDIGAGDIVLGDTYREAGHWANRSRWTAQGILHGGAKRVPGAVIPSPTTPTLIATAIGSGKVKLTWTRNRETAFEKYEVWRGDTDQVSNDHEFARPADSLDATGEKIRTETDQYITTWVDGVEDVLDVAETYYWRVYTFNRNGRFTGSAVVSAVVT